MLDSAQQIPSIVVIPVNEHAISEKWLNKYGAFPKDGKSLSFLSDARRFVLSIIINLQRYNKTRDITHRSWLTPTVIAAAMRKTPEN